MNIDKDTRLGELIEKLDKKKEHNEFDDMYNEYKEMVENDSSGFVTTNKGEFWKMYAFYVTVIEPINKKYWEAYLGKKD